MPTIGNARPSETLALIGAAGPGTVNTTPITTGWIDTASWESVLFTFLTGDMAAETIDFKIEQATSAAGAGAKDLVAATQLAAHASNNDSKQVMLECRAEELDRANSFRYVRGRAVTGGATGGPGCIVAQGFNARHGVGTDAASVVEIKQA